MPERHRYFSLALGFVRWSVMVTVFSDMTMKNFYFWPQ